MLAQNELQSLTDDYWDRTPVDIHFLDSVMLYKLLGKGKIDLDMVSAGDLVDGGLMIRTPIEYAPANTSSYGASTVFSSAKASVFNAARFGWAGYQASNLIDLDDQTQNAGKEAMVDLAFGKLRNIQTTIRDSMGTGVYGSNQGWNGYALDTNAFNGLSDLFDFGSVGGAYGTILTSDIADWKANVIATAESISFPVLQKIRQTASVGQSISKKPDLYVTTEVLRDGYESTLQVQARYSDKELVQVGFMNVLFGLAPVVADDKLQMAASVGSLYAMNLRFIKIRTHRDYSFTKPIWRMIVPTQPDLLIGDSRWRGQLTCSNRKAHCAHTNLSLPA